MGKPMALNLVRAGFDVIVASRSRPPIDELTVAGAREVASLAEVAASADVVLHVPAGLSPRRGTSTSARTALAQHTRAGQVLVETSTIGPALARETAAVVAERGAGYLDAPISGGVERAVSATLTIMAGGEERHFQTARASSRCDGRGGALRRAGRAGLHRQAHEPAAGGRPYHRRVRGVPVRHVRGRRPPAIARRALDIMGSQPTC